LKFNVQLQRLKINLEKLAVARLANRYPDIYDTHWKNPSLLATCKTEKEGIITIIIIIVVIIVALQPFVGPWPLFQFLDLLHSR
jgi:hypothetical protein